MILTAMAMLLIADTPDLPNDWKQIPYVQALKDPKLRPINMIEDYIGSGCDVKRHGGRKTVTVHLAFLVDDAGKIKKVVAQDNGCRALEDKVTGAAPSAFRGVIQPAPAGTMAWYQTEIDQNW